MEASKPVSVDDPLRFLTAWAAAKPLPHEPKREMREAIAGSPGSWWEALQVLILAQPDNPDDRLPSCCVSGCHILFDLGAEWQHRLGQAASTSDRMATALFKAVGSGIDGGRLLPLIGRQRCIEAYVVKLDHTNTPWLWWAPFVVREYIRSDPPWGEALALMVQLIDEVRDGVVGISAGPLADFFEGYFGPRVESDALEERLVEVSTLMQNNAAFARAIFVDDLPDGVAPRIAAARQAALRAEA